MKNYLQVNYDGSIFQYSKEDKEGFIKHENSKGKVSYRKYFNKGVDGTLTGISKENNQYLNNAEEVRLTLQNGDNENILTFTVLNQDGNSMDDYTEALTLLLPKMNKGETYNINNWYMKKGETVNGEVVKYSNKGVTAKQNGEKIKSNLTFEYIKGRDTDAEEHVKGDVPMLHWADVAGKNRPTAASKETRLIYLYNVLKEQIDRINGSGGTATTAPKKQEPVTEAAQTEDSPLPF